ncbi:MAG: CRISPR-associated protein Cas4 [Bacteroidaceae bacterium]
MIEYLDEDLLMLSGIQHFCFCHRQWALIHLEQAWADNRLTIEGEWFHQRVDDPLLLIKRKDTISLRAIQLVSRKLGIYGLSDVVEMSRSKTKENAILYPSYNGFWKLNPIEYKRGKPKKDERDEVQLCAQAICLEEMYRITIPHGFLYYGETRHRELITFSNELRQKVEDLCAEMHLLFKEGRTPLPKYESHCKSCSLNDICLPKSFTKPKSVKNYLESLTDGV